MNTIITERHIPTGNLGCNLIDHCILAAVNSEEQGLSGELCVLVQ